ncbi:hypothetical protein CGRA01v4_01480 [Colletotrichum graminicola]|nr:hypothetical protein CGRA01v4_01480 [Colletotrichum graminicola]
MQSRCPPPSSWLHHAQTTYYAPRPKTSPSKPCKPCRRG